MVPGIYHFCDSWCERCRFRPRCRLFRDILDGRTSEPPDAARGPDGPGDDRLADTIARHHNLALAHPLRREAHDYAELTRGVLRGLEPILEARGDEVSLLAVETLARHANLIGSKTFRAALGLVPDDPAIASARGDSNGPDVPHSDANGSAKVVRLLIAESRVAWRALMREGHARANGVPAAMVARLDDLDRQVASAFPRAMEFVRPGFDEEEASSPADP
jgi:hypothetical protein